MPGDTASRPPYSERDIRAVFAGLLLAMLLAAIGTGIGLQFPTSLVAIEHAVPGRHVGVAMPSATLLLAPGAWRRRESGAALMRELLAGREPRLFASPSQAFPITFQLSAGIAASSFVAARFLPDLRLRPI